MLITFIQFQKMTAYCYSQVYILYFYLFVGSSSYISDIMSVLEIEDYHLKIDYSIAPF